VETLQETGALLEATLRETAARQEEILRGTVGLPEGIPLETAALTVETLETIPAQPVTRKLAVIQAVPPVTLQPIQPVELLAIAIHQTTPVEVLLEIEITPA
jgi:hypothetical protein